VTLIAFEVLAAWAAAALLSSGHLMVAVAPAVIVTALLISCRNGPQR
jgi:hypothetical protein